MINSHPAFSGNSIIESDELMNGVRSWMSSAIYRSDRIVKIEKKKDSIKKKGTKKQVIKLEVLQTKHSQKEELKAQIS
jgi:hypothetical protein